jgi:deoxyribodipyrimidine photo-lyase
MTYSVVWFKRDLRLHDHAALAQAGARGPVLCLYVVEPGLWAQPDGARQHYEFVLESLRELARALRALGARLLVRTGAVPEVLAALHAQQPFAHLYSHQETGNAHTYARDQAVARWCRAQGVQWQELAQFGVVRALKNRDHWHAAWAAHTSAPQIPSPAPGQLQFAPLPPAMHRVPSAHDLGLAAWEPPARQRGGRSLGLAVLDDFLRTRWRQYRGGISSPLSAPSACSRLSPHLAYGTLSLREVVQATQQQMLYFQEHSAQSGQALQAFLSRLHWHCHFIQKLESEPELEWRNLHCGYDGLREHDWNPAHFAALQAGRTGWPLVDACVAMLHHNGWLNFRMRAMLVSVAAYPLWLHWREVGHWLAREFLDYEPGIHWSQMQMQSGTTGINTTRVYNPIKQARDHDPTGRFVRHWCPALRQVPDTWLWEPWRMPASVQQACGVRVHPDAVAGAPDAWPLPCVDLASATRTAKERLHRLRAQSSVREAKAAIVEKHGSRKAVVPARRARAGARSAGASTQLSLGWDSQSETPHHAAHAQKA